MKALTNGVLIRAAVLGTGSIGARHMQVLKEIGVSVLAIPIRAARRFELERQGWNCAQTLTHAKDDGATVVVVATDTLRHADDVREALRLGFHVMVEKPMASTATEAADLPNMARERGLTLVVGCALRFDPGLIMIRRRLSELGAVHSVRIECRSYLPEWRPNRDFLASYSSRAEEGGVLRDLIHEIDYALWLFGLPERVCGEVTNLGRLGIQSEEMAEGHWMNYSGTCISIGLDYLSRFPYRRLSAHGELGDIEYDLLGRKLRLQTTEAPAEEIAFPREPNDIYINQMNEFLSIVAGGASQWIATAEDGLNALLICDAWRQSAASRDSVPITP